MSKFTGTIGIMCRIAYVFRNKEGGSYTAKPLQIDMAAPAWIQGDKLFNALVSEGRLVLMDTKAKQKAVENDPAAGTTPDGKARGGRKKKEADSPDKTPNDDGTGEDDEDTEPDNAGKEEGEEDNGDDAK